MDYKGLTKKEAEEKLKEYGFNEIKEISKNKPLKILYRQVKKNFIVYLLLIAAIISFFVDKKTTAYTILGVITLVIGTGFFQEYRAEKAIQALKNMIMPVSIVIRNGNEQEISSSEIVPGDILVLRTGEKIPADCLILEETELTLNESALTGESHEIHKHPGTLEKYDERNVVFMGTHILKGKCIARVIHTGMNAKFGKISELISKTEKELPLQVKLNNISKYMAIVAIIFAILTGTIMILTNVESETVFVEALILMIALSVSAFPEGLPVVLITCLSYGAYKMAQKNAIVNRLSVIETLGETTVICSDKTGTITKGEMTVSEVFTNNSFYKVTGSGYSAEGDIRLNSNKISLIKNPTMNLFLKSAVVCNDAVIQRTGEDRLFKTIGSATESALMVLGAKAEIYKEDLDYERIEEIPFDSANKIMSTLNKTKDGKKIFAKGALEFLIRKCKYIQRDGGVYRLTEKEKSRILEANKTMTSKALRTIALAYKSIKKGEKATLDHDFVFLGIAGMQDPPREEVKNAIKMCLEAGISVKMITGDNLETAKAIGVEIGLNGKQITGDELDKITDDELTRIVGSITIFARVRPEHKLRIVNALKACGEIVTMTGDGVNDAPALKEAHIGVAMGKNGTDVSRSVADLTLKDDNFATIVTAIREGRTIFKNIRKFTSYMLSCNYAELAVLLMGVILAPFFGWQIPLLLALQILFMNLVTDDLPAITLAMTPSSENTMKEKPRRKEEIINKNVFFVSLFAAVIMTIIVLVVFYIEFNILNMGTDLARTSALLTLILLEIGNAYNFLSYKREVFIKALFANKYLTVASVISLLATILIIYTPANTVFGTVPMGIKDWIVSLISALIIITFFNIAKRINNAKGYLNLN
jgi:Ca2+-transporting ATPase